MRRIAPYARRGFARGFSLLVTLFVILVLAALAAFAMRIGATQEQSADFDLLNARARAAAASGIEYGAYQVLHGGGAGGVCFAPTTVNLAAKGLRGFSVTVTCFPSTHTVSGGARYAYLLTATAQHGLYGSADFVQASATRSVNDAPP